MGECKKKRKPCCLPSVEWSEYWDLPSSPPQPPINHNRIYFRYFTHSQIFIKKTIFEAHYKTMMKKFHQYKKLKDIKGDIFRGLQNYFYDKNISNARIKFKIRSKMVDKVPGNFKKRLNLIKLV